jgi:hypothetical protein
MMSATVSVARSLVCNGQQQSGGVQVATDTTDAVVQAVLKDVSSSLLRRGYLTTEWWTTVIGGALSTLLALVHINASSATHVVAVAAPAVLAGLYALTRTMHKTALASALSDAFPQAAAAAAATGGHAAGAPAGQAAAAPAGQAPAAAAAPTAAALAAPAPAATTTTVAQPTVASAQTDPDFVFQGIPPIADDNA